MLAWIYHYLPFFSMSRQLFLHHYLPAHLCSALVAGAVFHFAISETINYPVSVAGLKTRRRPRMRARTSVRMVLVLGAVVGMLCGAYYYLSPLTYGTPGLDPDQVNRRRILSSWTLVSSFLSRPFALSCSDADFLLRSWFRCSIMLNSFYIMFGGHFAE